MVKLSKIRPRSIAKTIDKGFQIKKSKSIISKKTQKGFSRVAQNTFGNSNPLSEALGFKPIGKINIKKKAKTKTIMVKKGQRVRIIRG